MIITMDWAGFDQYKFSFSSWDGNLIVSTFGTNAPIAEQVCDAPDS